MTQNQKIPTKFNGKLMILCLAAWFIICTGFYSFIHIRDNNRRQSLIKIGVSISKDISSQSGLPLLEKNILLLSQIIEKTTQKPEVVFASIIDHKNKIIAYSDQKQFLTLNRQKAGILDDVYYWRTSNPNNQRVMNFSSDVTFSGTRVGEVFISLAMKDIGQLKRGFAGFAISTLLLLVIVFGTMNYKQYFSWLKLLNTKLKYHPKRVHSDLGDSEISCPLCGNKENFSLSGFQAPDLEKFSILKEYSGSKKTVLLQDIANVEELSWLKRLLVVQCTGIIKKIMAE